VPLPAAFAGLLLTGAALEAGAFDERVEVVARAPRVLAALELDALEDAAGDFGGAGFFFVGREAAEAAIFNVLRF
jgi:hypothetical protein